MSKKIMVNKKINKGYFYLHNDKNGGHPALIIWKNDNKNTYIAILFTHVNGPNRIKLTDNIDSNDNRHTYALSNYVKCKRKDLNSKSYHNFKISKIDKKIIELIKRKNK